MMILLRTQKTNTAVTVNLDHVKFITENKLDKTKSIIVLNNKLKSGKSEIIKVNEILSDINTTLVENKQILIIETSKA